MDTTTSTTRTPPSSPRSRGEPQKIDAKRIFTNVTTEVEKAKTRRTDLTSKIEGLQDPRNIFVKGLGGFVETENLPQLGMNYCEVKESFEKYQKAGVDASIPKEIVTKFEEAGVIRSAPAYIDAKEADELNELAFKAEQALEFKRQLDKCDNFKIEGNLKDSFKGTDKELSSFCSVLKAWIVKNNAFPDAMTDDADPTVFKFLVEGEIVETKVDTKDKLDELQTRLTECHKDRVILSSIPINTLNASDPFGSPERGKRAEVLRQITELGGDKRTDWDKFWGILGWKTENVERLEEENRTAFKTLKDSFSSAVEGSDFDEDVIKKMAWKQVEDKLEAGKPLTDTEVKQLQAYTLRAMQRQRYMDDLKKAVPEEIEGNLREQFNDVMPKKEVFDKYLHKLKEALIRGNYPGLVTSHEDVRKFIFFTPKGEHKEITVNSLEDLDTLQGYMKQCVTDAMKNKVEDLLIENNQFKKENQQLKEQLNASMRYRGESQKDVSAEADRAEMYQEHLSEAQDTIAELRRKIEVKTQESERITQREQDILQRAVQREIIIKEKAIQVINKKDQKIQELEKQLEELRMQQKLATKMQEGEELEEVPVDQRELQNELITTKRESTEFQSRVTKLSSDLEAKERENEELRQAKKFDQEKMLSLEEKNQTFRNELTSITEELREMSSVTPSQDDTIAFYIKAIKHRQKELEEMNGEQEEEIQKLEKQLTAQGQQQ